MKLLKGLLLSLVAVFVLAACSDQEAEPVKQNDTEKEQVVEQDQYPKTIVDGRGKEVTIKAKPTKIVSTTLAVDEYLIDLTALENIAAVTQISSDAGISNVAGKTEAIATKFETVTAEQVLALNPDLVIIPSYVNPEVLDQLDSVGITTFQVIDDSSFEGILKTLETIGDIIGEKEKANALVQDIQKRIDTLKANAEKVEAKPRVLYFTEYLSSVTNKTTIGEMIELAGGMNVIEEAGIVGDAYPDYPNVSKEVLVELNPEIIFTTAWGSTPGEEPAFVTEWKKDSAIANVDAIKNNQIYVLDGANVTTASHYVIEGAEEMASILSKE